MATLREIRRRISGVKNTQKITKAMKMVAAARLRRAQEAIISTRPYARKLGELLRRLVTKVDDNLNPLLLDREIKNVLLVVVTADRGLCGSFNGNIIKAAANHLKSYSGLNVRMLTVGRKGADFFGRRNFNVTSKHPGIFTDLDFSDAREIVQEITEGYLKGEFDKVDVIYNEFKSVIQQRIIIEQLLPIPPEEIKGKGDLHSLAQVDYICEPSAAEIVNTLLPDI